MSINAIRDALKALAQSLQLSTIFPAGLFVLVNAYVVLPTFFSAVDPTTSVALTIMVSSALMMSYTLYDELGFLRARHQELSEYFGQPLETISADERLVERFEERKRLRPRLSNLERRFDRDYPSSHDRVLATRLGNTIAAFEDYPRTRYGMDSIALWGRLIPVLKEKGYLEFVIQEKSVLDFLMNTCVVILALGVELVPLALYLGRGWVALLSTGSVSLIAVVLYHGMVIAARQWGTTVRVAFDLYRHDLRQRLGLKPAESFGDERRRWEAVSAFFLCRNEDILASFDEFIPASKLAEQEKSRQL